MVKYLVVTSQSRNKLKKNWLVKKKTSFKIKSQLDKWFTAFDSETKSKHYQEALFTANWVREQEAALHGT